MNAVALKTLTHALTLVNAGLNLMDIVADVKSRAAADPAFDISAYLEAKADEAVEQLRQTLFAGTRDK